MLFASKGKLYLDSMDSNLGVYPQVNIYTQADGTYETEKMLTGLKTKPGDRTKLTVAEAVVKYGAPKPAPKMEVSAHESGRVRNSRRSE